jgi:predicted ATP-grasp superfamily ATP-dependent carboligase
LIIAPDHLLSHFTRILEEETHNLGCGSIPAALCANKQKTGKILLSHGIAVPEEPSEGLKVIKPILGCGSIGVRLTNDEPGEGEFSQRYIDGEHMSVSLIGSRVVGEACLYFSGKSPLPLAVNRQFIDIRNGFFSYNGGETPIFHPRHRELMDTGEKVISILGCQGYAGVDMVVKDKIYVVDVNPRIRRVSSVLQL